MALAMKQIIDKFKAMEKIANETLAADPEALVGVDSLPGSEHDAKVPEDAKKPDEEVTQGQPAGATTTSGAVVGGDAKPLNEGKLEMDEPLLNPEKKPLITDDALTAKVANEHLASLVNDLLSDIKGGAQKQAKADTTPKEKKIVLDDETISKLAAAQAAFNMGREAADSAIKKASAKVPQASDARSLIKAACIKAAQEQGLDPAAAEAAAENAMATAGIPPEAAPAAAAAEDTAAAAVADEAAAEAQGDAAGIPDDVTEEELATAIVDLVSSGELDPGAAKALVEEIAGDAQAPSEDDAAQIIAQGLESGEITPEQAQQIAAAVEGAGGAADAGDVSDEAQGAADAEAAIQDAKDEAAGAAAAEEAMKEAAAMIRHDTISKVASAIVGKRQEKQAAASKAPGGRVMAKVASILKAKQAEKQAEKQAAEHDSAPQDSNYIKGFKKRAEELGVDPSALARYVVANQPK